MTSDDCSEENVKRLLALVDSVDDSSRKQVAADLSKVAAKAEGALPRPFHNLHPILQPHALGRDACERDAQARRPRGDGLVGCPGPAWPLL